MSAEGWAILFVASALLNLYLVGRLIKSSCYAEFKLWDQQNGDGNE